MGELAQLAGDQKQARSYFEAVLDEDASFDLAFAKLYAVSVNTQSFETFLARLSQRVELAPTRYFTRNLLAQYHFYYGNAEQARIHYDVLLKSAPPETQYAIYNRLAILTLSSEPEKSLALATEAYKRNPTNADVLHTYGWALTVNNKAQEALPILRDASVRDATSLPLQYHLAYTLASIGNHIEAKRILITLLKKDDSVRIELLRVQVVVRRCRISRRLLGPTSPNQALAHGLLFRRVRGAVRPLADIR